MNQKSIPAKCENKQTISMHYYLNIVKRIDVHYGVSNVSININSANHSVLIFQHVLLAIVSGST